MKFFRSSSDSAAQKPGSAQASNRLTRRSSSLGQLVKELDSEEALCVLDLGSTSPANIRYCTERGHKIYSDDLLVSSTDPSLVTKDETGKTVLDSKRFLEENLVFPAVVAQAGRESAGLLPHPRSRPRSALLQVSHCRYRHSGDAINRPERRREEGDGAGYNHKQISPSTSI